MYAVARSIVSLQASTDLSSEPGAALSIVLVILGVLRGQAKRHLAALVLGAGGGPRHLSPAVSPYTAPVPGHAVVMPSLGLQRERLVAPLLFVGLLAAFVVVQRGAVAAYDGRVMYGVARAITHHRLSLTRLEDPFGRNSPYASFGIGLSLLVAPLYLLQQALHVANPLLVTLANPLLLAGTGLVIYWSGRRLGWSPPFAVLLSMLFAVLTMALQSSTELFSEPGVALATGLVILGFLLWRERPTLGALTVGVGVGIAILFRSDSALLVAPAVVLLPLVVPLPQLRRSRALLCLALPVLVAVGWTSYYSLLRSGTLVPQRYGGRFTTPLLEGLRGLLLSHGKSFFVFNPFLLLAVPGALLLWRRQRGVTVLLLLLASVRALFYARWNFWTGDVCWGPRFLMPCTVPLVVLAGEALRGVSRLRPPLRVAGMAAVLALGAAAVVVNLASVWVPYEAAFNDTKLTPGLTGRAASTARYHNLQDYTFTLRHSAIGYNLSHLHTRYWALRHFRGGASPVGITALALSVLAPALAGAAGRSRAPASSGDQSSDQDGSVAPSDALPKQATTVDR